MLETLTDLPDFFMENEELGSCVRRSEWSEKRDSNPRPRPWQGRALPTELFSQRFQATDIINNIMVSVKSV